MAHASLTRRLKFSARHRYWNPALGSAENAVLYGVSADADYHAHNYICDVTVRGKLDPRTGMVIDLAEFDRIVALEVRRRFDGKTINEDVPEFRDGELAPSGENLAKFVFERLHASLHGRVQVTEVTVSEDDTLRATYRGD